MKKTHILCGLFVALMLLLTYSCASDAEISTQPTASDYKVYRVSFDEILTNAKFYGAQQKVQQLRDNNVRRKTGKMAYDDNLGFFVDENKGVYIESGNSKSLTFPIYREGASDKLENLVLNYVPEKGEYKSFITQYDVTPELAIQLEPEQLARKDKKYYELTEANNTTYDYVYCTVTYAIITIESPHYPNQGSLVGDFKGPTYTTQFILVDKQCDYGSGGTGDGGAGGSGPSLGNGGGGSSGNTIITTPLLHLWQETELLKSLSKSQQEWWDNPENQEACNNYVNYLVENGATAENLALIKNLIDNSIESGLFLDAEASAKSPFNIDMTGVNGNSPEEQRFNAVYNKLKTSPLFRNLLVNMFESSARYNVSFEVGDLVVANGRTVPPPAGPIINNRIIIDKSHLREGSDVSIATTIVHEMIHAYLNVLRTRKGATPSELENDDLANCIIKYGTSLLWTPANQHNFMAENFGTTIQQILVDIKDSLFTAEEIHKVEHPEAYNDFFIYLPNITPTTPTSQSTTKIPWNWGDFFMYQSYEGLDTSPEFFTNSFPIGTEEYYYFYTYTRVAIRAFGHL